MLNLPKVNPPTSNESTKAIKDYLNSTGWKVWRNNQIHVPGRAFIGLKGVSDLIGLNKKSAMFIAVEVKYKNDSPTDEQTEFINLINNAGGFACAVWSFDEFLRKEAVWRTDRALFLKTALIKTKKVEANDLFA